MPTLKTSQSSPYAVASPTDSAEHADAEWVLDWQSERSESGRRAPVGVYNEDRLASLVRELEAKPGKGGRGGRRPMPPTRRKLVSKARELLLDANQDERGMVRSLGCERCCLLLQLAESSDDGREVSFEEESQYVQAASRLVAATSRYYVGAGVVAALLLAALLASSMHAFVEGPAAAPAAEVGSGGDTGVVEESWLDGARGFLGATARLVATGTACLTVLLSSRLGAQLCFAAGVDLDMQVWFLNESATAARVLDDAQKLTLLGVALAFGLEFSGGAGGLVPLALLLAGWAGLEAARAARTQQLAPGASAAAAHACCLRAGDAEQELRRTACRAVQAAARAAAHDRRRPPPEAPALIGCAPGSRRRRSTVQRRARYVPKY